MFKRIVAVVLIVITNAFSAQSFAKSKSQYFEIRVYSFKNAGQKSIVEDYLKNAAIPAYNRAGIGSVGVFDKAEQKDGLKLYIIIPYNSIDEFFFCRKNF